MGKSVSDIHGYRLLHPRFSFQVVTEKLKVKDNNQKASFTNQSAIAMDMSSILAILFLALTCVDCCQPSRSIHQSPKTIDPNPNSTPTPTNTTTDVISTSPSAEPTPTTPGECRCISICKASSSDNFKKDWCETDGHDGRKCGQYNSSTGTYWDICLYQEQSDDRAMTWKENHDKLWRRITEDDTIGEYNPDNLQNEAVSTTFDNKWDVMPEGREKHIHSVGAVCQFAINISDDSPYTGLLKAGATAVGLIRMAPATKPGFYQQKQGLTPGVAVKFLRTGTTSANMFLLPALAPLPDNQYNFFAKNITNHVSAKKKDVSCQLHKWVRKACTSEYCLGKLGISHLTTHDQEGNSFDTPIFPFKITFDTAEVNFPENAPVTSLDSSISERSDESMKAFMNQFTQIPVGKTLYRLRAHSNPLDVDGKVLGSIVTTDKCVTSKFGDNRLFFQHRPVEEDQKLRPEWEEAYQKNCGRSVCASAIRPSSNPHDSCNANAKVE